MHHHYADIRNRIDEEPRWWDEYGTPRYCEFGPHETADIYRAEACLLLIQCQNCGRTFQVCMSWSPWEGEPSLAQQVESRRIHYGDPPNVGCCAAGATMNCIDVRVLEFWHEGDAEFERVPELEKELLSTGRL